MPRLRLPHPDAHRGRAGLPAPGGLFRTIRRVARYESLVLHLEGRDGPLLRALALAGRGAVIVPGPSSGGRGGSGGELLRACREASHRMRVARVGVGPSDSGGEGVEFLPCPDALGPAPLPAPWLRWLEEVEGQGEPLVAPPWRALRLLPEPGA